MEYRTLSFRHLKRIPKPSERQASNKINIEVVNKRNTEVVIEIIMEIVIGIIIEVVIGIIIEVVIGIIIEVVIAVVIKIIEIVIGIIIKVVIEIIRNLCGSRSTPSKPSLKSPSISSSNSLVKISTFLSNVASFSPIITSSPAEVSDSIPRDRSFKRLSNNPVMQSDIAKVGDTEGKLIAALSILLPAGNTTKLTRDPLKKESNTSF